LRPDAVTVGFGPRAKPGDGVDVGPAGVGVVAWECGPPPTMVAPELVGVADLLPPPQPATRIAARAIPVTAKMVKLRFIAMRLGAAPSTFIQHSAAAFLKLFRATLAAAGDDTVESLMGSP